MGMGEWVYSANEQPCRLLNKTLHYIWLLVSLFMCSYSVVKFLLTDRYVIPMYYFLCAVSQVCVSQPTALVITFNDNINTWVPVQLVHNPVYCELALAVSDGLPSAMIMTQSSN